LARQLKLRVFVHYDKYKKLAVMGYSDFDELFTTNEAEAKIIK